MRTRACRWGVLTLASTLGLSCKTTIEAPTEPAPATVEPSAAAPSAPAEPTSPWPMTLLDAKGHTPRPDGPRPIVWVAMDGIALTTAAGQTEEILPLRDGRLGGAEVDPFMPVLYRVLAEPEPAGVLEIWADAAIPTDTIVRVLYSSGRAGFTGWSFVVGTPGAREVIEVEPTRYNPSADAAAAEEGRAWADLSLAWGTEGVMATLVSRRSETEELPPRTTVPLDLGGGSCIVPGGARPDPSTVGKLLEGLCILADGKRQALRVHLGGDEPIGDVLAVLASDPRPASCRLPAVVEAGPVRQTCQGARPLGEAIAALQPGAGRHLAGGGAGFGGRGEAVPKVVPTKAMVEGPLDSDIVRRIVRAHVNEVRFCYTKALQANPELAGVVTIGFSIDEAGEVSAAEVRSSTLPDDAVGKCIVGAVKRWKFPKPASPVLVEYPFTLAPG